MIYDGENALSRVLAKERSQERVCDVAFSPDGRWLAAGMGSGRMLVWRIDRPEASTVTWYAHTAGLAPPNSEPTQELSGPPRVARRASSCGETTENGGPPQNRPSRFHSLAASPTSYSVQALSGCPTALGTKRSRSMPRRSPRWERLLAWETGWRLLPTAAPWLERGHRDQARVDRTPRRLSLIHRLNADTRKLQHS